MGERTLIVGDIHGCWDEFRALLDAARIGPPDRIVAVGDLCDRGPAASSVMGNHEWKHVRGLGREAQWITEWQCGYALYTRAVAAQARPQADIFRVPQNRENLATCRRSEEPANRLNRIWWRRPSIAHGSRTEMIRWIVCEAPIRSGAVAWRLTSAASQCESQ